MLACAKPTSIASYYHKVVSVSHNTALALQSAGSNFVLLLYGDDHASKHMESMLQTAMQHQKVEVLVVKVQVAQDNSIAQKLSVAMVPQLRAYRDGGEIVRHRGTIDYGKLIRILSVTSGTLTAQLS